MIEHLEYCISNKLALAYIFLNNDPDFAEQLLCYQLPKILNENGSMRILSKVFTHSFSGFNNYIKNAIINTYIMHCNVINLVSCSKFAN